MRIPAPDELMRTITKDDEAAIESTTKFIADRLLSLFTGDNKVEIWASQVNDRVARTIVGQCQEAGWNCSYRHHSDQRDGNSTIYTLNRRIVIGGKD